MLQLHNSVLKAYYQRVIDMTLILKILIIDENYINLR